MFRKIIKYNRTEGSHGRFQVLNHNKTCYVNNKHIVKRYRTFKSAFQRKKLLKIKKYRAFVSFEVVMFHVW